MQIKKPETFDDLLNLQKILDENISDKFSEREKTEIDILDAIKDEKQEWLKELPYHLNFKTWKRKEYSRDKELEEITDILFFILQLANYKEYYRGSFRKDFDDWRTKSYNEGDDDHYRKVLVAEFEESILIEQFRDCIMSDYNDLCSWRKFSKEEILNKYWEKWNFKMEKRKDWTLKK